MLRTLSLVLLPAALLWAQELTADPWYSDAQRLRGEQVYQSNCLVCQGPEGEATSNWHQPDADGNLPPPPLNGTAHTWHHSPKSLANTVRKGGKQVGGVMPGFADSLSLPDMVSVIAYLTSLWPTEVYASWI